MTVKFNTAYFIGKEELFTKFKGQTELLKKNGVKCYPTHSNDTARVQFIGAIADSLKQKTHEKNKETTNLSFKINGIGDTDASTKDCEIVYARIPQQGKPMSI